MEYDYRILQLVPNPEGFYAVFAYEDVDQAWKASLVPFPLWALVEERISGERHVFPMHGHDKLELLIPKMGSFLGIATSPNAGVGYWDGWAIEYGRRKEKEGIT